MIKCKEIMTGKTGQICDKDLEAINRFSKAQLNADDVFTFDILLCDNEIDRDFERFTVDALDALKEMFVGKAGIFDHTWSAHGQKARIYKTEVIQDDLRTTQLNEPYVFLKASAYMLTTQENSSLIDEIRGGIKKEVSVGCSVGKITCSICGEPVGSRNCSHIKGCNYDGSVCCHILDEPTDAYEWSFVAVPAQREAGVIKRFENGLNDDAFKRLEKEAQLGRAYLKALREETARLGIMASPEMSDDILNSVLMKLDESELTSLKTMFEKQIEKRFPPACQLTYQRETEKASDENYYKI